MNETTFPPKGNLPQFSSYLASYQLTSSLKQGIEHKTFYFNFETSMAQIVMATPPHGKSSSIISQCHTNKATSEDRYACKNIACKELKDKPRLGEELRDSN